MPKHLLPGNVSYMSSAKINENLYSVKEEKHYVELTKGGGYFSKFDYQESPYSLFMDQEKEERYNHLQKQIELHGNVPFRSHPLQNATHKH